MEQNYIKITREELYEQVWQEPMTKLAKKYNISDVGLAKICKKMEIEKPWLGYWAKVQHGIKVKRPNLKKASEKCQQVVLLSKLRKEIKPISTVIIKAEANEFLPENQIKVSNDLTDCHKLTAITEKRFKNSKPHSFGVLLPNSNRHLDIRVCKNSLNRALRIFDAIIRAAENRGFSIVLKEVQNKFITVFQVHGEKIHVHIEEKPAREPHQLSDIEKDKLRRKQKYEKNGSSGMSWSEYSDVMFWRPPQYDYFPSGNLFFKIDNLLWSGTQQTWSDGKTQRLEDLLNKIMVGLVAAAEHFKIERAEKERREKEWEERRKILEREKEERIEEQRKIQKLKDQANAWDEYKKMKAYIEVLKKTASDQKTKEWIDWAEGYLTKNSPIKVSDYEEGRDY